VKDIRQHGEAGLVDVEAVEKECKWLQKILAPYALQDWLNGDKTGLFGYSPPDWGLATTQMSGKKQIKTCLSILFTCNADGSEKFQPLIIGKWKKPHCFQKPVEDYRFYYWNNKKAWMTSEIFEEWVLVHHHDLHFNWPV
jgi:hypothetical protein